MGKKKSLFAAANENKKFARTKQKYGWLKQLPEDVQEEIQELREQVVNRKLWWSIDGTRRFVRQELKKRGIELLVVASTWRSWWHDLDESEGH